MTTTVIIQAHCDSETKEVEIVIKDNGNEIVDKIVIQDGETSEQCAYDDREIIIKEVEK